MYISYSGFKTYLTCPRDYWHRYIGRTKPPKENRINMLYGSAIGTIFEYFYNDKLWRAPDVHVALTALVEPTVKRIMQEEVRKGGLFNWLDPKSNYQSIDSLYDEVHKSVRNGLAIIKQHRLLGPVAVAEMKLDYVLEGHTLGGRADFVIERTRPLSDLIILDGKGSRHREKYVDGMQLRWYAMLYRFLYGATPDKLGFVFWRYGPDEAVDWVDYTPEGLTDLSKEVLATIAKIDASTKALQGATPEHGTPFPAMAELGHCRLCSYLSVCPEGQSVTNSPLTLAPGGVAIEDVSLD